MKQTAVQWLIERFNYEGFIGTYCDEEQIKSKRELMIEIINEAKEIEKQQIIEAFNLLQQNEIKQQFLLRAEEYYNETFKNK